MQTRFLVVALAVSGLLVAVGVWLALTPNESPRPRVPTIPGSELTGFEGGNPLLGESPGTLELDITEPVNTKLAAPPVAPPLVNDPAAGTVWLRLIDADTNRPLSKKSVSLLPVGYAATKEWRYLTEEPRPAPRMTDPDGLIALSVSMDALTEDLPEASKDCDVLFDVPNQLVSFMHLPVPRGWYPTEEGYELAERLYALHDEPTTEPVTLWVRRNASVTIVARDRWGVPIHDAKLKVDLLLNESVSYDWIETFCTPNEGVWAEDWQQEADELRQELRSATMRCTVNSTFVPDVEYDREFWESNSFMSAGNSGVVDYHDLPCIGVGAVAWHPLYGTATATLQLESGRNSLDVFFTEPTTSELRVRVNSQPASSDPGEFFELSLVRSSPFGVNMFIEDSSVWLSRYWEFAPDAAVWEAVFTGVPPGWWYVSLTGASDAEAGANVELASGESKTVQLHVGENAQAQWTPVVRSGGVQLKEASFFLLGGVDCMRSQMTVVHDTESGKTEPLFLSPGTWTVWMPTLPAFTFTLKPGEKRQDIFELRTITVSFVLELDLAMYLGDPKEGALLDLLPDGEWEDVYEHLHALDQRMRQSDENYDQLMPGVASVWTIPCGEYQWNLSGNQRDLSGRMRFTPDGPTRVVFGTDSLPGYETLVVDLVGFDTDDPPDVWIDEDSVYDAAVAPQTRYYYSGPVTIFPGIFEQQLFDDVRVESIQMSHDRRIFFARAGSMFLEVSGDGVSGRRAVTFPGSITLRPNQFGMTSVRFVTPETEAAAIVEDIGYEIEALTESGGFERVEDWDWAAPPGKVTIRVMRRSYYADEKALSDFIQFEIELKTKPVVIELSKLNYQPLATLDLVFRGRGSPEQTTDAWWFPEDGPTAPRLYALDAMTNGPRIVAINRISEYMPQGRLEFTCRGLDLPPGNYRVVPWPDAPPKYCREFTLKAGGHTEIIVQGG